MLRAIAKNQQTDEIEMIDQLKVLADQIEKDVAKFNKALLVLSFPDRYLYGTKGHPE